MKTQEWIDSLAEFPGFPQIVCGWPDEEHERRHHWVFTNRYRCKCGYVFEKGPFRRAGEMEFCTECDWLVEPCESLIEREKVEELDCLGFSHENCDLCNSGYGGERHAATALPENPAENKDYLVLSICPDCAHYYANGDLPDWLENE